MHLSHNCGFRLNENKHFIVDQNSTKKCPSLKRGQMNYFVFNYVCCVIMAVAIMRTLLMRLRMPKIKAHIYICWLFFFIRRRVFFSTLILAQILFFILYVESVHIIPNVIKWNKREYVFVCVACMPLKSFIMIKRMVKRI